MNKYVRKLIFLLTVWVILGNANITVFATSNTEYVSGYLRYTVEDGSVTIIGYNGRESEVTVPAEIAGVPVNIIASGAFEKAKTVTKVNLPDTIMTIEKDAFSAGQTVVYNSNTNDTGETKPNEDVTEEQNENQEEAPTSDLNGTPQKNPESEGDKDSSEENKDAQKDSKTDSNETLQKESISEADVNKKDQIAGNSENRKQDTDQSKNVIEESAEHATTQKEFSIEDAKVDLDDLNNETFTNDSTIEIITVGETDAEEKETKTGLILIVVVAAIAGIGGVAGYLYKKKDR